MIRVIKTELTDIHSECGSTSISRVGSSCNADESASLLFLCGQGKQTQTLFRFWPCLHGVKLRNSLSSGSMLPLLANEFQLIADGRPG